MWQGPNDYDTQFRHPLKDIWIRIPARVNNGLPSPPLTKDAAGPLAFRRRGFVNRNIAANVSN
jgi:hypothetical protein